MKSFTLNGAWAAQELQTREVRDRCSALEQEVVRWKSACEERDQHLAREREKLQRLENTRLPELENRLAAAEHTVRKLMDDLEQQQLATQKAQESGATAVAVLQGQLDAATADNAVLKAELAKHMHLRAATHNKVEEAKRKLGLSQPEAEFFIHDLDETKAANKSLKAEVATLAADKARLEQQCDSRSQHAMTLIAENKRLLEQVSELRKQVTASDQDLWRLRQDLAAAKKVGARTAKKHQDLHAATQARPEWQGTASAARAPSTTSTAGRDVSSQLASSAAAQGRDQGVKTSGGRGGRPGPSAGRPAAAETATVLAVRQAAEQLEELRRAALQQALACRQQRLAQASGAL